MDHIVVSHAEFWKQIDRATEEHRAVIINTLKNDDGTIEYRMESPWLYRYIKPNKNGNKSQSD